MEPTNLLAQNELGDSQKLAPCGGRSNDPGIPTNAIAQARGGDKSTSRFVKRSSTRATIE
jgi:hypothetical protein